MLTPIYVWPGVTLYVAYFAIAGLAVVVNYVRDIRKVSGRQRAEMAFILIGAAVTLATLLLAFVLRLYLAESRLIWFAPFRIVLFSLIIAYGMATRKIMEVGLFLRRAIAYSLVTTYLLVFYGLVWSLVAAVTVPSLGDKAYGFSHVVAAVIIAFAMAPARGLSQTLADRLFVGTQAAGFSFHGEQGDRDSALGQHVERAVAEICQDNCGGGRHGPRLHPAAKPDRLRAGYILRSSPAAVWLRSSSPRTMRSFHFLETHQEPLVLDELHRIRLTPELERVARQMESLQVAVAMGIFSREHLAGVMLLGPRLSGRIYGSTEQNALQVLCGQMAVAIENAQLFTEVQNAKIYNEILLQNLTTGVVAAGSDGRITVFNQEAAADHGREKRRPDRPTDRLPARATRRTSARNTFLRRAPGK